MQYVYDLCDDQLDLFQHDLQKVPSFYLGGIGQLLAMAGGRDSVNDILNELTNRIDSGTEDTPYYALGLIYNVLGESEKAIDFLEKAFEVREPFIIGINFRPSLEPLRSNKRFQELLVRLGFEI